MKQAAALSPAPLLPMMAVMRPLRHFPETPLRILIVSPVRWSFTEKFRLEKVMLTAGPWALLPPSSPLSVMVCATVVIKMTQ